LNISVLCLTFIPGKSGSTDSSKPSILIEIVAFEIKIWTGPRGEIAFPRPEKRTRIAILSVAILRG